MTGLRDQLRSDGASLERVRALARRPRPASVREITRDYLRPYVFEQVIETKAAIGGRFRLEVGPDGWSRFSGRIRAGGATSHTYHLLVVLRYPVIEADGSIRDAEWQFVRQGEVFGALESGSDVDEWNIPTRHALNGAAWAGLRHSAGRRDFQYDSNLGAVGDVVEFIGKVAIASTTLGAVGSGMVVASTAASSLDLDELVLPGLIGVVVAGGAYLVLGPGAIYPAFYAGSGAATVATSHLQRRLKPAEVAVVRSVFHGSVDTDRVMLTPLTGLGGRPFVMPTHGGTILVNLGQDLYDNVLASIVSGSKDFVAGKFVHEMTHVWQIQNTSFSPGYFCRSWATAAHTSLGDDISRRIYATGSPGKNWDDYGVEAQCSIVEQWYLDGASDNSPWFRYIHDNVRRGRD